MSDSLDDCTLTPPVNTVIPLDIVLDTDPVGINAGTVELTEILNPPVTTTVPLNIAFDPECIGLESGVVELLAPINDMSIDLGFISDTAGLSGVVELTAPIHDMTIDVLVEGKKGDKGDKGDQGDQGLPGLDGVGIVHHGDDPNFPRPDDPDPVVWEGTVLPNNWLDGDLWINPETNPTPVYASSIVLQDPQNLFASTDVESAMAELRQSTLATGGLPQIYDSPTPPTAPLFPYLRVERDADGDVQAIYLGTET